VRANPRYTEAGDDKPKPNQINAQIRKIASMDCDIDDVYMRLYKEQGHKPTIAQQAAIAWVKKALTGDVNALDKMTDRNEGKVSDTITHIVQQAPKKLEGDRLKAYQEEVTAFFAKQQDNQNDK